MTPSAVAGPALLKGSFRPDESICQLLALQRERADLVAERTPIVQRMQKALDQMNVQVHHAVSDLTGKTGLAIVRAIVAGERNPTELAKLRDHRCRKSEAQIAEHLTGNWRAEHLFNLRMGVRRYDEINLIIAEYDTQLSRWIAELPPPESSPPASFRMLRYGQDCVDEGVAAYEAHFQQRRLHQLIETARQRGYQLVPALEAA